MRAKILRIGGVAALAVAIWFVAGFASAQRACAHDPRFACSPRDGGHAVGVPDPAKSWAFYGRLAPSGSDSYVFEVTAPLSVPVSLLVAKSDAGNPARPALEILAAGGKRVASLGFDRYSSFFEPFSSIDYLSTPQNEKVELRPGVYSAVVSMSPRGSAQRYVFAIGDAERFSVAEIPYVLGAIYRVRRQGF